MADKLFQDTYKALQLPDKDLWIPYGQNERNSLLSDFGLKLHLQVLQLTVPVTFCYFSRVLRLTFLLGLVLFLVIIT